MNIRTNILMRIYFVFGIIFVAGCLVLWKVYFIQQYKKDYWIRLSEQLNTKYFNIPAERGNIYSADERLLATSLPYFDIYVDFMAEGMTQSLFDANVDGLSKKLSATFGDKSAEKYKKELVRARKAKKRYYPIRRNVGYDLMKDMQQWPLFKEGKNKGGLIAEMQHRRKNPYGHLAARTIGYTRDNAPDVGLEASYNQYLSGKDGGMMKQKIAGNVWMPIQNGSDKEPVNGKDIHSTIHINIQDVAEAALWKALDSSQADFGCAVVMEVKTGAIRAMANLGRTKSGALAEIQNYAATFSSQPGSTFKLASYLALLDDGFIRINDSIYIGSGNWNFYGNIMRDDHPGDKTLTASEAFARSSNVAVAQWTDKFYKKNKKALYQKYEAFGLTKKTNIDLLGEPAPSISTPDKWSRLSIPWKSTGYELMLTPLQLLTFYNAVANDGIRVEPHLVQSVSNNGKLIKSFNPSTSQKTIASKVAIQQAKAMLRQVVEDAHGTARSIRSEFVSLAGKTGTAKLYIDGAFSNANQAMFAGYFPADRPVYSCIVMIYHPKGIYRTGGGIAAPVFRAIADRALSTDPNCAVQVNNRPTTEKSLEISLKGETQQIKTLLSKYGYQFKVGDHISFMNIDVNKGYLKIKPQEVDESVVPDLKGLTFDDAVYLLENVGLKIMYKGIGKVTEQSVQPGSKAKRGDIIQLRLSTGV
jgi:cell division protein FtsI (penicillin-binding protein 3)